MDKIAKLVTKYPLWVIITILIITSLLGMACFRLERESDIKKMMPENSLSVTTLREIDEKFGGADTLFIAVEDQEVFDYPTLSKIQKFTNQLKELSDVSQVRSITDMEEIKGVPGGIEIGPLLAEIPKNQKQINKFKQKLLADDKYAGVFISKENSLLPFAKTTNATLILVSLYLDRDPNTIHEIRSLAQSFEGPEKFHITGSPQVTRVIMEGISTDMIRLIPLVIFLVSTVLYLGFRNWYGVVLPLACVFISSIWAMGTMALFGRPITVVSSAVPALLISVGSAYGIHLIARIQEERGRFPKEQILSKALNHTGLAIFIAAVTTAVGFASNVVSDITAIRTFGLIIAFGILSTFIITVTFIPAVFSLMRSPLPAAEGDEKKRQRDRLNEALFMLSEIITTKKFWSLITAIALLTLAIVSYPRISTETDPVRYFRKRSPVVKTAELVKNKFGGVITLDLVLEGDLKDPRLLRKIEKLQAKLTKIEILGQPYSIVDALKETHRFMNEDRPEFEVIPQSRQGIAQYLLLLSMTGGDFMQRLITPDQDEMLMTFRVSSTKSTKIDKMVKEVKAEVNRIFPDREIEIKLSGMAVVLKDMREMLISNHVQSITLALLAVFFMIFLIYRTFSGAFFCMIPIFLTLLLNFGVMGWFGIPLDMATVMVSSIAIGLGIDYSVHLFNRYREERRQAKGRSQSIDATIKAVGKPIVFNAAAVALGFIILTLSQFQIMKNFGILVALTMLFSSLGALAILPDLMMAKDRLLEFNHKIRSRR